ncbi:transcriptional regulator opi1, partial [Coemansia brasiliensis]
MEEAVTTEQHPYKRISILGLVNSDEVEAAEALGSLRSTETSRESVNRPQFMQHVQAIPLVSSALEIYDRSRQSSALIRAGSNVIESGVRRMCSPIAKHINVEQLDSFACRQLSNLGYEIPNTNIRKRTKDQAEAEPEDASKERRGTGWNVGSLVANVQERAVAYRQDSMRRLRYCLDWVIYATALLQQHMRGLAQVLEALRRQAGMEVVPHDDTQTAPGAFSAGAWVGKARKEIVGTVRRAVGVVSQYAGSVLPGDARRRVRELILGLPSRWATVDSRYASSSVASNGSSSPFTASSPSTRAADSMDPAHIEDTARRTLAFASESFHMLNGIRAVFTSLHANAERWIGASSDTSMEPEPVPTAPLLYREPTAAATTTSGSSHRPLPPIGGDFSGDADRQSTVSLLEIGEQMRRMDVHASPSPSWSPTPLRPTATSSATDSDSVKCVKRNRTREPTPTR